MPISPNFFHSPSPWIPKIGTGRNWKKFLEIKIDSNRASEHIFYDSRLVLLYLRGKYYKSSNAVSNSVDIISSFSHFPIFINLCQFFPNPLPRNFENRHRINWKKMFAPSFIYKIEKNMCNRLLDLKNRKCFLKCIMIFGLQYTLLRAILRLEAQNHILDTLIKKRKVA